MDDIQTDLKEVPGLLTGPLMEPETGYEIKPAGNSKGSQAFKEDVQSETNPGPGKISQIFERTIQAMGRMMEVRDPYTASHQVRASYISAAIARTMGLSPVQVKGVELAALIHDIGKLAVPSEILSKPGHLSAVEFDIIKTHPLVGYRIIRDIEFPWPIDRIVLQHHERMNGSGYPAGQTGSDILLEARILSVADVIEAMSSNRPYRPAIGTELAIEEICKNKYVLYDGDVVDACLLYFAKNKSSW